MVISSLRSLTLYAAARHAVVLTPVHHTTVMSDSFRRTVSACLHQGTPYARGKLCTSSSSASGGTSSTSRSFHLTSRFLDAALAGCNRRSPGSCSSAGPLPGSCWAPAALLPWGLAGGTAPAPPGLCSSVEGKATALVRACAAGHHHDGLLCSPFRACLPQCLRNL